MNLPVPSVSCAYIVGAAGVARQPITPDLLGKLYAASLRAEGMRDKGTPIKAETLIQAFSNVMGCFVPNEAPKK